MASGGGILKAEMQCEATALCIYLHFECRFFSM